MSYFPDCWNDEERMRSLMSSFKKRDVNPPAYDAKMKFWKKLIVDSCRDCKDPFIDLREVTNRFRRKGCRALGLPLVLESMHQEGSIQKAEDFQLANEDWVSWGWAVLFKKPMDWLFGVGGSPEEAASTSEDSTAFIVVETLQKISEDVLNVFWDSQDDVDIAGPAYPISYYQLAKLVRQVCPINKLLDHVLMLLARQDKVVIWVQNGEKVVKFKSSSSKSDTTMTEVDKAVHSLRNTCSKLESDMDNLEMDCQSFDVNIKRLLREGSKNKALTILRKKKLADRSLKEKEASYSKMQAMLHQIQNSHSQKQILDAMQHGATAFRATSLSPDKVDHTLDDVLDALNDTNEISAAIAQGANIYSPEGTSSEELEDELKALLAEDAINDRVPDIAGDRAPSIYFPDPPASPSRTPRSSSVVPVTDGPPEKMSKPDRLTSLRRQLEAV